MIQPTSPPVTRGTLSSVAGKTLITWECPVCRRSHARVWSGGRGPLTLRDCRSLVRVEPANPPEPPDAERLPLNARVGVTDFRRRRLHPRRWP